MCIGVCYHETRGTPQDAIFNESVDQPEVHKRVTSCDPLSQSFLMSLFDLCVCVSVIIPYVIV